MLHAACYLVQFMCSLLHSVRFACCMLHSCLRCMHVAYSLHGPAHALRTVIARCNDCRLLGFTSHIGMHVASCVFHVAHRMVCLVNAAAAAPTDAGALAHGSGAWVGTYPITVVPASPMTASPTNVGKAAATSTCAPPGGALRALAQTHCRIQVPHDRAWQPGSGSGVPLPPPLPSLWTDCDCCLFVCSFGPAEFCHCTSCPCQEADPKKWCGHLGFSVRVIGCIGCMRTPALASCMLVSPVPPGSCISPAMCWVCVACEAHGSNASLSHILSSHGCMLSPTHTCMRESAIPCVPGPF
jgi:hypothetical protein